MFAQQIISDKEAQQFMQAQVSRNPHDELQQVQSKLIAWVSLKESCIRLIASCAATSKQMGLHMHMDVIIQNRAPPQQLHPDLHLLSGNTSTTPRDLCT